jgi:probable HAF family extracellular repeat protein
VFLGSFDGGVQTSAAAGINDDGTVVGYSWGGGYNNSGPFIWSNADGFQHLTGFNGVNGYATGINTNGVVVGAKGTGTRSIAFVWSAIAGQTDIPDVQGATQSVGFAINDSGVVVGRYTAADSNDLSRIPVVGGIGNRGP